MNTKRSDTFIKNWIARPSPLRRECVTARCTLRAAPEAAFALLCPTTEYDWIESWSCTLLHSRSGRAEYNAIFRTTFLGHEEIWVCTRYEPGKAVEYSRTAQDFCVKLDIGLTDNCDGTTTLDWVLTGSALSEDDSALAAVFDLMRQRFGGLFEELEHYLETGEMLVR